jgi:superfamily II DNA or RNA helicase
MSFTPGALVTARGREWVVQPDSTDDLLLLRPVGGADNDVVGILTDLEPVGSARFDWPSAEDVGSSVDAQLLRDAVKLGFRSSAGPFRSFAKIAVEPRPYQLVPLLMAMRLDPVRLLIGDSVGVGKTVQGLLIAVELLATGQAERLAVLCPPHLAEQWAAEMTDKFHLDPTLVLSSTAPRLERGLAYGESLFDRHRITVVSTDFIKSDRRRAEFLRAAPELIIVDEAHTCAADPNRRSARHQRHELVRALADDSQRHLILMTAVPHSGKEGAFRSLLRLLHPRLADLDDDGAYPQWARDLIANHFIQRTRREIQDYLDEETPFPERFELPDADGRYPLTADYAALVDDVRAFSRERLMDDGMGDHRQRMRYWAVLGLLRHVASSPRATAATLRNRNPAASTDTAEQADEAGRDAVLDADSDDEAATDTVTGVRDGEDDPHGERLEALAQRASDLEGAKSDGKLAHVTRLVRVMLREGFNPIVFTKYIESAEYVADHLRAALPSTIVVDAVTGRLPADQRERAVHALGSHDQRVLVATDCLSEGINLQKLFSAVIHYDLPWAPTGLEQREGRVNRYGQESRQVRIATVYSPDTVIDELVMDVLLRKHRTIRSALGVAIPVPVLTDEFLETAVDRLFATDQLFVDPTTGVQGHLDLDRDDRYAANKRELFTQWDTSAAQEETARTRYGQRSIKTDEVRRELDAVRGAIGSGVDVARFVTTAVRAYGGTVEPDRDDPHRLRVDLTNLPADLRDTLRLALDLAELPDAVRLRTEEPTRPGELLVTRTHPFIAALAAHTVDGAFDRYVTSPASRAGAIRTDAVDIVTVLLLLRHRYDLTTGARHRRTQLVEATSLVGFATTADGLRWLDQPAAEALTAARPVGNLTDAQREQFARTLLDPNRFADLPTLLDNHVRTAAQHALEAHRRVREQAGGQLGRTDIAPHLPPDVLGAYLLIPAGS